jgi:hypothetical protein
MLKMQDLKSMHPPTMAVQFRIYYSILPKGKTVPLQLSYQTMSLQKCHISRDRTWKMIKLTGMSGLYKKSKMDTRSLQRVTKS